MNQSIPERLKEMRGEGWPTAIPHTDRVVRLKSVEASALLQDDRMPDILTPLVIKSVYTDLSDNQIKDYLEKERTDKSDALAFLSSIDYICALAIADDTNVEDLVLTEKRWVFRLVLGPAELLVKFRDNEKVDVGLVDAKQAIPQASQ